MSVHVKHDGNTIHNPEPSTARGKRRHSNRSEDAKNRAEKAWSQDRSVKESRFLKELRTGKARGSR